MTELNIKEFIGDKGTLSDDDDNDAEGIEDGIIKDSVLKLTSNTFDEISPDEFVGAKLRNFNIASQNDIEAEYKGKTVSRKSILKSDSELDSINDDSDVSAEYEDDDNKDGGGGDGVNDCEIEENDNESGDSDFTSSLSFDDVDDDYALDDLQRNDADESSRQKDKVKSKDNEENDYKIYSKTSQNVADDIAKGNAIRNQLFVWESLLECRIKLQKALMASNRLPQFDNFSSILSDFSEDDRKKVSKTCENIGALLQLLLTFQKDMIKCYPEFKNTPSQSSDDIVDDESVSSSVASGFSEDESKNDLSINSDRDEDSSFQPPKKIRKLEDFSKELHKQHLDFIPSRNEAIQKWNDKTRISSGRLKSSNFSAFDQSTLKQIEQILCDKSRLIKRTQTKRSAYEIVGKINSSKSSEQAAEIDPEIFDDDDFYHKLLREFIEQKSADVTSPQQMGRQWVELQKIRSKMKRPIDIKATKGRRLRYTTHPKLVNFMAPVPYNSWTDEAESELFSSLFGEIRQK